jgi:RhtB (resistance to homoserine/threonine) family protein
MVVNWGALQTDIRDNNFTFVTYIYLLLSLLAVDLLAAISPGPNFVLVTQTAIQRTRPHAVAVVLGLVSANLIWCAAVVFGLSALFEFAPWLYGALKFLGGAYLIYLGVSLWRTASSKMNTESSLKKTLGAAYIRGLLTNLSNPKSVVYFGSIFTLFMRPATPAWLKLIAVGIVLFDTVLWYGSVALLFSSNTVQRFYIRLQRPVNRVTGALMFGFGARLMLVSDRIP